MRVFWSVLVSLWLPYLAWALPVIERPITDQAQVIAPDVLDTLETQIRALRAKSGTQLAILVVKSTNGTPIEDYAHKIAEAWGGGAKEYDNGVLFVLALEDRRMRLEVGSGLEPLIPDAKAKQFTGAIRSHLKRKDYEGALRTMVQQIEQAVSAEPMLASDDSPAKKDEISPLFYVFLASATTAFIAALFALIWNGTLGSYIAIIFGCFVVATLGYGQPGAAFVFATLGHTIGMGLCLVVLLGPFRQDKGTLINRNLGPLALNVPFWFLLLGLSMSAASPVKAISDSGFAILSESFSIWLAVGLCSALGWFPMYLVWLVIDIVRGVQRPKTHASRGKSSTRSSSGFYVSSSTVSDWSSSNYDSSSSYDSDWDGGGGSFDGGGASDSW